MNMDDQQKKSKKFKSGHEKRIEKQKQLLIEQGKTCKKINNFFKFSTTSETSENIEQNVNNTKKVPLPIEHQTIGLEIEILNKNKVIQNDQSVLKTNNDIIENPINYINEINEIDYFRKPNYNFFNQFMLYHPIQPDKDIPFTSNRAFYRNDGTKRIWLTYSTKHSALFCSICLAFGTVCDKNTFTLGVNDWRHIYQRIEEHEKSKTHGNSVDAYFLKNGSSSVDQLLMYDQCNLRKKQVEEKRQVLTRIIDIIKMIGKRGLSYRGTSSNEAAYTLSDHTIDHGTFLEMVILLSKYDPILKLHIDSSIEKSKLCRNAGSKQRGCTLTFLSKTTVGYILDTCSSMIKSSISKEVIEAGMYSIQLDTTQDTSISDQCSIIIRYVSKFSVKERLIAMVKCKSSTGEAFVELLLNVLKTANIDILNCVGIY